LRRNQSFIKFNRLSSLPALKTATAMQKILFVLLSIAGSVTAYAQNTINASLAKELDSIYVLDQKYRQLLSTDILKSKADSVAASYHVASKDLLNFLITQMTKTDSSNIARVEQIVSQYGYPGKTLVGERTSAVAFFVIQHSKNIDKYLDVVKKAAEEKELNFTLYAMMLDRSLMYSGKEQIYGSQGMGFQVTNPQTGEKTTKTVIWPIKDVSAVNQRRKDAGFKDSVEENAKRLGIEYIVYTLEDVKKMQGQ
jgi:hypothetical protein